MSTHNAGPEHYCGECSPVKKQSGGWCMDRIAYSPTSKAKAYELLPIVRDTIELPVTDAMAGMRFKSNDSCYIRLESMYAENEFMKCPRACIEGAMIDAAQSDYWYAYEKNYDDDPEQPEQDEDE